MSEVTLVAYRQEWTQFYEREKRRLQASIGNFVTEIEHVGSTAIPGMAAKPIIDIGIAVKSFEDAVVCVGPMEKAGYEYRGENGIPRRHYFVKGRPSTHHVHMLEICSAQWLVLLSFRDYLRKHSEVANQYAELKRELAARFATDRTAYQQAKASFIAEVIAKAKQEGYLPW